MSWTDSYELPYATVIGRFGSVVRDSVDPDLRPDIIPLSGTITLTPTVPYIKINGTVLQIATITAQVVNGVVVNPDGSEGISILSTDVENDTITNWGWRATFKIPEVRITPVSFYAVKDEVIDLANLTSGITGLPIETVSGPKGDKGDPGEDGHTPEITFDGTTIVVDGVPGPDLKGEPGEGGGGGGGIAGTVPIFATLTEAQAWEAENPGKVALTLEGQEPVGPVVWEAAAPSFDVMSGTVTIPTDAGATYTVNGAAKAAGTHAVTVPSTVTVAAVAKDGYTLAGVMEWVQEFEENPVPYDGPASAAPLYYRLDEPAAHSGAPKNRGTSGTNPWQENVVFAGYGATGAGVGVTAVAAGAGGRWWLDDSTVPTAYTFACTINYHGASPGLNVYLDWRGEKRIRIQPDPWDTTLTVLPDGSKVAGFEGIHHVAWTWDGATRRIYIDGDLHMSDQMSWTTSAAVMIGALQGSTPTTTTAGLVIDKSRAWTAAEIKALSEAVAR